MRTILAAAFALFLASCAGEPEPVATGPRVDATLVATWPAAAPPRQAAFSRDNRLLAASDTSGLITVRATGDGIVVYEPSTILKGNAATVSAPNGADDRGA